MSDGLTNLKSQETVLAVLTFFQALAEPFILTFESLQLTL